MAHGEHSSPYRTLARTLLGILRRLRAEDDLEIYRLWSDWEEIVGAQVAHRVRPHQLRNGVLVLVAVNATWRQELEFLKPQLLARIREYAGSERVRDLAFTVGPLPQEAAPRRSARRDLHVPLEPWHAQEALAPLRDTPLAEAFERLVAARERLREAQERPQGQSAPRDAATHPRAARARNKQKGGKR